MRITSSVSITTLEEKRSRWIPPEIWIENGTAVPCSKCGKIIRLGEVCASERRKNEKRTIILCLDCLNDRYLDSDDPNDEYEMTPEFRILDKLLEGEYRILSYNKNWELVQEYPPLRSIEVDIECPIPIQ